MGSGAARGSRQSGREHTRQRFLQAAVEIVREQGVAALTTTRIAERVGIAQSAFYAYFKNVDDCLAATAEHVAAQMRAGNTRRRQALHATLDNLTQLSDPALIVDDIDQALSGFLSNRPVSELLLLFRHDPSPLGVGLQSVWQEATDELEQDLRRIGSRLGAGAVTPKQYAIFAEMIMVLISGGAEALIAGRLKGRRAVASAIALMVAATIQAALAGGPASTPAVDG